MIRGGLEGGLDFGLTTNTLNFFDEFKGLVRDAVRSERFSVLFSLFCGNLQGKLKNLWPLDRSDGAKTRGHPPFRV